MNLDKLIKDIDEKLFLLSQEEIKSTSPYIFFDGVKIYFKCPEHFTFKLNSNLSFDISFHYHNVEYSNYEGLSTKSIIDETQRIMNKILDEQIIKKIHFEFDIKKDINYVNTDEFDKNAESVVSRFLKDKYGDFKINFCVFEKNDSCGVFFVELSYDGQRLRDYFLFINSYIIHCTLKDYFNDEMKNFVTNFLLSASFTMRNVKYCFDKAFYKKAFEIVEETKNSNIEKEIVEETKYSNIEKRLNRSLSNRILDKLNKFSNLVEKCSIDSDNFNDYDYNFLLLGNSSSDKEQVVEYIKQTFYDKFVSEGQMSFYVLDLENDNYTFTGFISFLKKANKYGVLYIKNFEYINNFVTSYLDEMEDIVKYLLDYINDKNTKSLIISGASDFTLEFLKQNNKLFKSFSYLLEFDDYTTSRLYELLIEKISNYSLKVDLDEKKTMYLIRNRLNTSMKKNDAFVEELFLDMKRVVLENNYDVYDDRCLLELSKNSFSGNAMDEINSLIGLTSVKTELSNLYSLFKYKNEVSKYSNVNLGYSYLNMFFGGNPGTGKTTVARLFASALYELGHIKEDKLIEITPNDLTGEHVGVSKIRTREILKKAKGGILFIDEAYLLAKKDPYLEDAIIELIKYLENPANVVIFAGYFEELKDVLSINQGFKSRINYYIKFDNYSLEELVDIFILKLRKKGLKYDDDIISVVKEVILEKMKNKDFGNGRFVDKLIDKIIIKHANNMEDYSDKELLITITKSDIVKEELLKDEFDNKSSLGFDVRGDV